MSILQALRAANEARQREWDAGNQITLAYRGNELAGEAGEACNVIKKLERERLGIVGSRATIEQLAEELADVVICADLVAMSVGIELCEETPLPVFESKLDVWACLLMKRVGCVCERLALIAGLRNGMLAEDLDRVVAYVRVLALIGGVDLDVAIARKFNKTSIANGLATRMCEAA